MCLHVLAETPALATRRDFWRMGGLVSVEELGPAGRPASGERGALTAVQRRVTAG